MLHLLILITFIGSGSPMETVLPLLCPVFMWAMMLVFFLALMFAAEDGVKRLRRLEREGKLIKLQNSAKYRLVHTQLCYSRRSIVLPDAH